MLLGPLGQNLARVLCHDPSLTNCIEDGSSAGFPRTGPTFLYSLVKCDVEKPNFEWGTTAEEGLKEAARCCWAHLGRTMAMFFVMTLVSQIA